MNIDRDLLIRAACVGYARLSTTEIARACGVTGETVRVALGAHEGRVSDATRRRVLACIGLTEPEINERLAVSL